MPARNRDFAFEELLKNETLIKAAVGSNEATTRLRAIDTIVFDVLGWEKSSQVEVEKYTRKKGYADYVFVEQSSFLLVVEAKKWGATFVLPDRAYPETPVGFSLIATECSAADEALRQALGYAAQLSARYIAITNGHQWIIALTWVNNQRIDERSVFVFESFDAIKTRFNRFWECFGPDNVRVNKVASLLLESRKAPPPAKLSQRVGGYPAPANRNAIVNELEAIVATVLDEVKKEEAEEAFLRECYVEPEPSVSSSAQAKELLSQRLEADERIASEVIDTREVAEIIKKYNTEKPVIVLGKVGHGKSTFLKHLRKIKAKDLLDRYFQIEIDFIDRPDSRDLVGKFIFDEIERQMRDNYNITLSDDNIVRGSLSSDLDRFSRSVEGRAYLRDSAEYKAAELAFIKEILSDRHVFLQKVFHHFRAGRESSVAIFFDNLDRRNERIQDEAFLQASAIARDYSALVFVCLRPSTFYLSKRIGVMDSVAPKIIDVVSPKTHAMIVKRLDFARKMALGEVAAKIPFSPDFAPNLPATATFLDCAAQSFLTSRRLCSLFDSVSNGNARDLLLYVAKVLTSAHLNTSKIINMFKTGTYTIAEHEVLRCLLYGNYVHYDPSESLFINLFDIERADPTEHFTRFVVLEHLRRAPDGHPNYCFVQCDHVLRYLYQLGFSEEHGKDTLKSLFFHRCCESRNPVEGWDESVREIRITPHGRYHVGDLVRTFVYFDAVVIDTPIIADEFRRLIPDCDLINHRLERCEHFLAYLNKCAAEIKDGDFQKSWKDVALAVERNMREIHRQLAKSH